ncbi:universal stress protein, partial [Streptomyces sp. NRRL B-24572]|uniref:universal stress protein n=1 Tax=Streptomyces sp. NRRL B-24572 TaxID=1962156 RepID=UPI00211B2C26
MLLGVDPREQSIPALVWAAAGAVRRRGLALRLVTVVPAAHDGLRYDAVAHQSALRLRAESAIADAEDLVRELHDGLRIATELVNGMPATVLRDMAAHAALVVGSRRLGRAAEVFSESSVVVPLTARASCPAVVVREPEHSAVHPPTLVVGVDGSESSRAAVVFAVEEASLRE